MDDEVYEKPEPRHEIRNPKLYTLSPNPNSPEGADLSTAASFAEAFRHRRFLVVAGFGHDLRKTK